MSPFTVALLQLTSHGADPQANLLKGEAYCHHAARKGADVALFPEMWNIGYTFFDHNLPGDHGKWRRRAISLDSPFVRHFQALAKELRMAIGLTFLQEWPEAPRNTLALIDSNGGIALTYAKVHTCDFSAEAALTPGEDFYVCELDTAAGAVQIGAMICYDREQPESARILMLKGAEILLVPNACEMEPLRLGQLQARAYENMVGIALANYAAPQENGHSIAYDGIAFEKDERSRDMILVQAGQVEGIYLAHYDLEALRRYRPREVWGNTFRHPERYGAMLDAEVCEPFLRKSARR
jgi:N-carbamoylputrescine amidase